jgi:hypothetical protein
MQDPTGALLAIIKPLARETQGERRPRDGRTSAVMVTPSERSELE